MIIVTVREVIYTNFILLIYNKNNIWLGTYRLKSFNFVLFFISNHEIILYWKSQFNYKWFSSFKTKYNLKQNLTVCIYGNKELR